MSALETDSWVYFIQAIDGGLIKIGIATDVVKRLATLQTGSPSRLQLLGKMRGGRRLESTLHNHFIDWRDHGEWFAPVDELLAYIHESAWLEKEPVMAVVQQRPRLKQIPPVVLPTIGACVQCGYRAVDGQRYCEACASCEDCGNALSEGELALCFECCLEVLEEDGYCIECLNKRDGANELLCRACEHKVKEEEAGVA